MLSFAQASGWVGVLANAAFISCSSENLSQARALENELDNAGLPAWLYTKPLTGSEFPAEIAEAITTSSCVLLLLSATSASSKWVEREVHFAIENRVPIIPIVLSPFPAASSLNFRIAGLTKIDATAGLAPAVLAEISKAVREHYKTQNPVVAVMNMKGGVGKTTLTANLFGSLFKRRSKNILLIDLDPQYNLTQLLVHQQVHVADVERDRSVISAFEPGQPLGRQSPALELTTIAVTDLPPVDPMEIAYRVDFNPESRCRLDLIQGQFEIAKYTLPQNVRRVDACVAHFGRFINIARAKYDVVVIDVSPASSHLTLAAVQSATHVLAPVRPDKYSLRGLKAMRRLMDELFLISNQPEFLSIMNGVAPDSPKDVEDDIRGDREFSQGLLKAVIPHSRHFFSRNSGVATSLYDKLAINASGWNSGNIRGIIADASDELWERVTRNAGQISSDARAAPPLEERV